MGIFSLKNDVEGFKSSSLLGKLGYSALIISKSAVNVAGALAVEGSKQILKNPNSTQEQRDKAQSYINRFDK